MYFQNYGIARIEIYLILINQFSHIFHFKV